MCALPNDEHRSLTTLRLWGGRWVCLHCHIDQHRWFATQFQAEEWCAIQTRAHQHTENGNA